MPFFVYDTRYNNNTLQSCLLSGLLYFSEPDGQSNKERERENIFELTLYGIGHCPIKLKIGTNLKTHFFFIFSLTKLYRYSELFMLGFTMAFRIKRLVIHVMTFFFFSQMNVKFYLVYMYTWSPCTNVHECLFSCIRTRNICSIMKCTLGGRIVYTVHEAHKTL